MKASETRTNDTDEFAQQAKRVGAAIESGRVLNPYRLWKLEPRKEGA